MKTRFTTLCLFINLLLLAQAPEIEWTKNYGGSGTDYMYGSTLIQQTTDGGYVFATRSTSNDGDVSENNGDADYWIVKLNASGEIVWQESLGGSAYDEPQSIQQTTDGGYIIAGFSYSNNGDVSENLGDADYWIVKLDETGNIEWEKSYGGSGGDYAMVVQQTTDGGYIVAGNSFSADGYVTGNDSSILSFWMIKLNESGDLQWEQFYEGEHPAYLFDSQQTSDGGYIAVGVSIYSDPITGIMVGDLWIIKTDEMGVLEWERTVAGNNADYADAVKQTADGGYIISGYSWSSDIINNHGEGDALLVKLNSEGEIEWTKGYGGSFYELFSSVEQMPDGGYICFGWSDSSDGDVSQNFGLGDYWLVRMDPAGEILWEKSFGGSLYEEAFAGFQKTADGGFILSGSSQSNDGNVPGNHGDYDIWLIKLSSENMGITEFENQMILYPNPTTGILNIQTQEKISSVSVYNSIGQKVPFNSLNTENTSIDISSLPGGIYFIELNLNNKTIKRYKVIRK